MATAMAQTLNESIMFVKLPDGRFALNETHATAELLKTRDHVNLMRALAGVNNISFIESPEAVQLEKRALCLFKAYTEVNLGSQTQPSDQ